MVVVVVKWLLLLLLLLLSGYCCCLACVRDVGSFDIHGHAMGDASLNFQFARRFDFDGGTECHFEVSSLVFSETFLERLFEKRRVERVTHDHVATGRVHARLHFVDAYKK